MTLEYRLREFMLVTLQPRMTLLDFAASELTDDFSIVGSGLLDSMAFVEFVGSFEQQFGIELDFQDMDPSEYTTVGGFLHCALRASGAQ